MPIRWHNFGSQLLSNDIWHFYIPEYYNEPFYYKVQYGTVAHDGAVQWECSAQKILSAPPNNIHNLVKMSGGAAGARFRSRADIGDDTVK